MSDVFISYSRKNSEFADRLDDALKAAGQAVWIDRREIAPSAAWWETIKSGIDEAHTFVPIITPELLSSPVCTFEMDYALRNNKRIIPLMRHEVVKAETFGNIAAVVPTGFLAELVGDQDLLDMARANFRVVETLNWIFFRDEDNFDAALKQLIAALQIDLHYIQTHTRLLTRAKEWEKTPDDKSLLLTGDSLRAAENWLEFNTEKNPPPTELQRSYIEASKAQHEREVEAERQQQARELALKQRANNFLRALVVVFAVFAIAAVGLSVFALMQARQAQDARAASDLNAARSESLRLAAEGNSILQANGNAEVAALLGIRALNTQYTSQADAMLSKAVTHLNTHCVFPARASAVFAPKDSLVLTSGVLNDPVQLWNAQTCQLIDTLSAPAVGNQNSLEFSPDDKQFLTATNADNTVRLWDVHSKALLHAFPPLGSSGIQATFSPDGKSVLIYSQSDNHVGLWDTSSGTQLWDIMVESQSVTLAQFSPDGIYVLVEIQGMDGFFELRLTSTGEIVPQFAKVDGNWLQIDFSPNSKRIYASGFEEEPFSAWDIPTGQAIDTISAPVTKDFIILPTGDVAIMDDSNRLSIWNDDLSQIVQNVTSDSADEYLLTHDSDSNWFAWIGSQGQPQAFDTLSRTQQTFSGYLGANYVLVSSDYNRQLMAAGYNGARSWDVDPFRPFFDPNLDTIYQLVISGDGKLVAASAGDGNTALWETATGKELATLGPDTYHAASALALSPDATKMLIGYGTGDWQLGDLATGNDIHIDTLPSTDFSNITDAAYAPDGKSFFLANIAAVTQIDSSTFAPIHTFSNDPDQLYTGDMRNSIAISPDGKLLVSVALDKVDLWDIATGKVIRTFVGHSGVVYDVAFSPDGQYLLTGGGDRIAILWDVATGKPIRAFSGHTFNVLSVSFSPDSKLIITGSDDGTARIWDTNTGALIRVFSGPMNDVHSVAFVADGQHVLTGSADGQVLEWDVNYQTAMATACARIFRDFNDDERQRFSISSNSPTCPQFASNLSSYALH